MIIKVLLLLILILINGVLSASEIAFISLDKFTLQNKKDKKTSRVTNNNCFIYMLHFSRILYIQKKYTTK